MIKLSEILLKESKQSIINLGFPEIIAKFLYEKYKNKAYIIAKWYKDFKVKNTIYDNNPKWFYQSHYSFSKNELNLWDTIELYESTFKSPEEFENQIKKYEISMPDDLLQFRRSAYEIIKEDFFNVIFFRSYNLMLDIDSNKLKNLAPYKNLDFFNAVMKYDEKKIFSEKPPIKTYSTGYKWLNVGKRCEILAHYMRNCGSSGLIGHDPDRTLIALFSEDNKPHVMVTYSPNEKRLSHEQGIGSTPIKPEYADYLIDLINILDVSFDFTKSKSKYMVMKYKLKNQNANIKLLKKTSYEEYYKVAVDGKVYYTDGYFFLSSNDVKKIISAIRDKKLELYSNTRNINALFNVYNQEDIKNFGIKYLNINEI